MKQQEIWKDIPGYEGYYQVSDLGRIKSLDRDIKHNIGYGFRQLKGRILVQRLGVNKYYNVALSKNGTVKSKNIHQLVAEGFLNHVPCRYELVIDHIDNDTLNNKLSNIRIVTTRENNSKSKKNSTSRYTGVHKSGNRWKSVITINGKSKNLGSFKKETEASEYYQDALKCINEDKIDDIKVKKPAYSSKYKYVSFRNDSKKWMCQPFINGKQKKIGCFNTELEAHQAVLEAMAK